MDSEGKRQTGNNLDIMSTTKGTLPSPQAEEKGFIKRFLNWIAREANRPGPDGASCPS